MKRYATLALMCLILFTMFGCYASVPDATEAETEATTTTEQTIGNGKTLKLLAQAVV